MVNQIGPWEYAFETKSEDPDTGDAGEAWFVKLPEAKVSARYAIDMALPKKLAEALRSRMKDGREIPEPDEPGEFTIPVSAYLAAKLSVYVAWKAADISKSELARRMGRNEAEVRRILDPDHGTKLDQLEEAARALGGRLLVSFAYG